MTLLLAALLAAGPGPGGPFLPDRLAVELPDSPAREVAESVGSMPPSTGLGGVLGQAPGSWPAGLGDDAWRNESPWLTWADLLIAERDAEVPDAHNRAALALLAASQDRSIDAWRHYTGTAGEPAVARALLPHLFPGVPAELDPWSVLPEGVLLRPLLPPPPDGLGSVPATLTARGLRVGEALIDVELELARDGVQVDVSHVSGGPARLALLLPEPRRYEIRVDYLDWDRRETPGLPHEYALEPGSEPVSSWGRFAPRRGTTPGDMDVLDLTMVRRRGVVVEASDERRALASGLAAALARIFGIEATARPPASARRETPTGAQDSTRSSAPIVLRLADGPDGLAALRSWVALAERVALGD